MEHRDPQLHKLMNMSKMELPFDDFEDKVMAQIAKVEADRAEVMRHKKYALIFFVVGSLFGLILNYLVNLAIDLASLQQGVKNILSLCSQLFYVILIVLLSDKLWRLRQMVKQKP